MTAIALALAASLTWGAADFAAGLITRRVHVVAVAAVSQGAGFAALLLVALASGSGIERDSFLTGMLAGVGGGLGLAAFYRALATGTISVVAPIAACGAVVPLVLALAGGDDPRALALVGAVIALGGAVMASLEERMSEETGRREAVVLAALAALLLGLFIYFIGRASQDGDVLSALIGARTSSFSLLVVWVTAARVPLRFDGLGWGVTGIGLLDVLANALFAVASTEGLLAIVSVLGSLYAVPTVILAHLILRERVTTIQRLGVAVALAGVALVASGGT